MKSQIIVDMDFDTSQPVIRFKLDRDSDLLADKTLRFFIEKAMMKEGAVLYFTYQQWPDVPVNSILDLRCEVIKAVKDGDELDFIKEAKERALTYCKSKEEEERIGGVFDGWATKASIKMLNDDPLSYHAKYGLPGHSPYFKQ